MVAHTISSGAYFNFIPQAPRPTTLPLSPSPEQLATLLHPSSPGGRHLAAVLRTPLPCPSLALLRCVEVDPGAAEAELAAPRGQFLKAASNLHSRLVDLDSENSCLLHQGILLRVDFQVNSVLEILLYFRVPKSIYFNLYSKFMAIT